MQARELPKATPKWSLYLTYLRLAVCLVSLPLIFTGMVLFAKSPSSAIGPVLLITGCLYCDMSTVMKLARANRVDRA
jgi:hypothetical protein